MYIEDAPPVLTVDQARWLHLATRAVFHPGPLAAERLALLQRLSLPPTTLPTLATEACRATIV